MHYMFHSKGASAFSHAAPTAVEVTFWEGFLFRDKSNLLKTLCTYSLDNGPLPGVEPHTMAFRFTSYDWKKNIRRLLENRNIQVCRLREMPLNAGDQLLKKKVYIAEDDADVLLVLSTMLENDGYQVKASACCKPIMDGAYSSVDLFILDKQMPDMDGIQLCRHLREQASTKDTPILMISASPRKGNEALDAGATDYIEKPFQMAYLLNLVSKYTKRKR